MLLQTVWSLQPVSGPLQVKRELGDARSQLKEERGKREEAKSALISEQQHFASKLAELEGMTRGMTPVHAAQCLWQNWPLRCGANGS